MTEDSELKKNALRILVCAKHHCMVGQCQFVSEGMKLETFLSVSTIKKWLEETFEDCLHNNKNETVHCAKCRIKRAINELSLLEKEG